MDDNNVQKIDLMQYVDRFWRTLTRFKLILFLLFLLIVAFFVGQEVLFFDTTYSSTAVFVATNQEEGALFNSGEDDDELVSTFSSLITGNMILKPLVARLRPFTVNTAVELLIPPPADFSFPSGHTYASFASSTAILRNNRRIGSCALVLAILIAFSRLYLYVHYPTDVLFGILLGILAGWLGNQAAKTAWKRFPRHPQSRGTRGPG